MTNIRHVSNGNGLRNLVILLLLLHIWIMVSELVNIELGEINLTKAISR